MMHHIQVGLRVTVVPLVGPLLDAKIAKGHAISQRTWPGKANPGFDQMPPVGNVGGGQGHAISIKPHGLKQALPSQQPEGRGRVVTDPQPGIDMPVDGALESRQPHGGFQLVGAQHMDPVPVLQQAVVGHLDDAAAEIVEVVAQQPGKRPAFKLEMLDRVIPFVGLLGGIALKHI